VLSPSTSLVDRNLKKAAYERFGVESYWLVDPVKRTLVAFELGDGSYHQVANLRPDDVYEFERPFPVHISMRELCRKLDPD
jgi:Uma2 family endonuclease